MPKVFTSKTQKIGEIGESIAVKFLMKQGFKVIERNYTKKCGEIDIIALKQDKIYFIEVKSVSKNIIQGDNGNNIKKEPLVTCETRESPVTHVTNMLRIKENIYDSYNAEDNMHPWKLKRLSRTIQTYLMSNRINEDREWQVDLLVVYLDVPNKKAQVKVTPDIVL